MDKQSNKATQREEVEDVETGEEEHVEDNGDGEEAENDNGSGSDENPEKEKFSSPAASQARFDKLPANIQTLMAKTAVEVVFNACLEHVNELCKQSRDTPVDLKPMLLMATQVADTAKTMANKDPAMMAFLDSVGKLSTMVTSQVRSDYPRYEQMWLHCTRSLMYTFRHEVFPPNNSNPLNRATAPDALVAYIKTIDVLESLQMLIDFVKLEGHKADLDVRAMKNAHDNFNQRQFDTAQNKKQFIFDLCDKLVQLRQRCEGTWKPKPKFLKKPGQNGHQAPRSGFRPVVNRGGHSPAPARNDSGSRPVHRENHGYRQGDMHEQRGQGYRQGDNRTQDRRPYQPGTYQMQSQPSRQPTSPSPRGGFRGSSNPRRGNN